ncbi:proprotein convertase P-domain-containing protein [Streptomyces sp. HNM0663]|uniref:Proprotein convertase P-domain-containing protein n=1 Tax=Streptomyces chengmaiensis TaxID=3040919 RepID=A0ABT6I036_9ACTN|nr:proprotein convertase P-domain-containing protein [Streptomyces chengmaiensis]MDH2394021.1 proprotein convertase P-domain-containing protein [Streptomyces chengmaiensis]
MFLTPQAHPGAPPARTSVRTLLTHLITATLIATSLVLAAATPSHAAPGNHKPVTWNMQGASSSSDSKWTTTIARMVTGGDNYFEHDVVALQEAGPRRSLPGTAVRTGRLTVNGRQATYEYAVHRWRIGSATRGRDVYITWLNTDPTGHRNNVAIVTHEDPGTPTAVAARQANNRNNWGMRPALGIQLSDGSRFWSFHASSNGDNRSNDAQNMLVEIQSASSPGLWAVLGDFNRRPDNLTVPPGSQIYSSGQGTQQTGGELDYMVSNDQQNMQGWTGRRLNGAGSDHFPVEFAFRAAANTNVVSSGDQPGRCLGTPDNSSVAMLKCDATLSKLNRPFGPTVSAGFSRETLTNYKYCLSFLAALAHTAHGSMRDCQSWEPSVRTFDFPSDGRILHRNTGYCLDTSSEWNWEARLWWCNTDTYPLNQNFVQTAYPPYYWYSISVIGPETGTEDAQTGGPGAGPGSDGCPMPSNPTLDPCHHISKRSTTDVSISDHVTVESSITVSDISGNAPANLGVGVDIEHTHRGDLTISLIAPSGTAYLLEDIPDHDSSDHVFKSYTVDVSSERANGTWTLRVRDTGSGNTGKIDAWNLTFPASSGSTSGGGYFENTNDVPILDNRTNDSLLTVSGLSGNAPSSLAVGVDIKHTYRGDLSISLVGPSGTKTYLLEDFANDDSGEDVNKTYIVDASPETANGTWTLRVNDFGTGDTGTIDAWNLTFPASSAPNDSGSGTCFTPGGSPIPC